VDRVTYRTLLTKIYDGCRARTDSAEGGTDRVNPTVSFTSSNRIDAGSTYVLSGVVADNIGVASATVILNNSGVAHPLTLVNRLLTLPGQISLPNSKLFNYSFNINDLNLGVNTFTVVAKDEASNSTSVDFKVVRMNTATVNQITSVTVTPKRTTMLVGTTNQLTSDVAVSGTPPAYQLEWLSSNPSVATVSNTGLVTSVSVGDATVTVRVVEQPTLSDTAQILVRARQVMPDNNLDIVDPEIAVSPLTATVNEAVYPVVATITDNVGVTEVRMSLNGTAVQTSALVSNVLTKNVTLREGPNTILITAFDAASNSAAKTLTITYNPNVIPEMDNVPPVVTIDSAGLTTSVNYVISGRVQDASSALGLATVSVNGGNERALTLDSTGRFAKTLVLAAGVNSLKVTAFDAEGNEGTATKSVLVSTDSQPDEFAVSVSFDASADYPVNPLRPQLRGTVPFKKVVVNLYRADTNEAIYTVFQHCVVGETGCTTYSNNQYTTPINNLDVTAWAQNNLTDGLYYYKAYAKRGDLAAENFSAQFKYVNAQVQIPPNLPYHPCDYYFTDVPAGVSACNAVALVRELGVFYGNVDQYGQRVFRPNDPLLRTELFAIANRFARLPEVSYNPSADGAMGFSDLKEFVNNPEASWFMTEIKRMRRYGNSVIQGYPDGTLRPLVPILIAENAKVILEAGFVGNVIAAQRPSIDLTKQPWWQDYTTFLASRGVNLSGPGGEVITRSEVAQFFANLYLRGMLR